MDTSKLGYAKEMPQRYQQGIVREDQVVARKRAQADQTSDGGFIRGVLRRPVFVEKRLPVTDVTERISQMANGACLVREMSLSVEELRAKTQYQLADHPSRLHRAFALKILNSF